jgi:hypothetical protein
MDSQFEDNPELSDDAVAALHELELGVEWLHRAHGHLLAFHHNTGHAMEHIAEAEHHFRECGREDVADAIRREHLPRGVIDDDRWSYDVLECFESGILAELNRFEVAVREDVADGVRHVAERQQEREWKQRAEEK